MLNFQIDFPALTICGQGLNSEVFNAAMLKLLFKFLDSKNLSAELTPLRAAELLFKEVIFKADHLRLWAWPKVLRGDFLGGPGGSGRVRFFRNCYIRFVKIPRGPQSFMKKCHFLGKKVKVFKNAIFSPKNLLPKILGGGKEALNKNFKGRGDTLIPNPKNSCMIINYFYC